MTTEPKAEGGPDWDMAAHWIDRYAAGVDEQVQLDRVCDALGCKAPPDDWFGPAAMAHPTPSAVEALARAAKDIEFAGFAGRRCPCCLGFEGGPNGRGETDYAHRSDCALNAALAHPEIAALLKEKK